MVVVVVGLVVGLIMTGVVFDARLFRLFCSVVMWYFRMRFSSFVPGFRFFFSVCQGRSGGGVGRGDGGRGIDFENSQSINQSINDAPLK